MLGPNALTQKLLQSYLRYLFSAHPIGVHNANLEALLRKGLQEEHPLVNGPILELDPASRMSATVADLIAEGALCEAIGNLRVGDLPLSSRILYTHQVAAIRASAAGESVVVASGTGSGKTEAWLYPVVSEMLARPKPGLRAIVLYPMNALADDQRRIRMRGLLSGTAITYGEYTGNTPRDERSPNAIIDPNAPLNELQTRRQLREAPPNILITNPSMLEYLLLRPEDNALFRDSSLQYLILDEAHTYRGAYGIELGHLIRRLKARLAVRSVRAFVLSATMDKNLPEVAQFARSLTGESFAEASILFGEQEAARPVSAPRHRPMATYSEFTSEVLAMILADPSQVGNIASFTAFGEESLLRAMDAPTGTRALWELLHDDGNVIALRDLLRDGARPVAELAAIVFGPQGGDIDGIMARLIDAAASARETSETVALLPARYHVFLRGLDGLRICVNPEHGVIGDGVYAVGKYYLENRDACDCGYPLWELLVCGRCAAWYLRDRGDGTKGLDLEVSGAERTWHLVDTDEDNEEGAFSERCLLCRAEFGCECPPLARRAVTATGDRKTCLNCQSDDVMGVMTGTMAPTQVIAEVLTKEQDSGPTFSGRGSGKKLLAFSDSRRAAAQFAAQLDRAHKQHVRRAAIYRAIPLSPRVLGLDLMAPRVAKILRECGFFDPSPNNEARSKAIVFEEFTASYANRRRLEAIGLAATRILLESPPPQRLVALLGSEMDAAVVTQTLLEMIQYDSAVTRPEDMAPLGGFAGARPDVFFGLSSGPKRWISPNAPLHQRRRGRQFNLALRLVGAEKADFLLTEVWNHALSEGALVGDGTLYQIVSDRIEFFNPGAWYRCTSCRRVTPYALSDGRGCPTRECDGALLKSDEVINGEDHFTRNIIDPINYLRIEEHTAQLSTYEARRIGKEFRDGEVNILSCSTTFELGVDIGTLQSVFMRNVPPSVANYRQRAGRAGRTRQGAAYLLTYCGPNPHDRVFFERPTEIIAGELTVPEFNLSNELLAGRHVRSLLLGSLWRFVSNRLGERRTVQEFLLSSDSWDMAVEWSATENPLLDAELLRYTSTTTSESQTVEKRPRFLVELAHERDLIRQRLASLESTRRELTGKARRNIENAIDRLSERRLIDHLSARAFLPSYAFPIYVVELQTPDKKVALQRDLRIAINEYAPGSQVVANKRLFQSTAVVLKGPMAGARAPYVDVWICESCQTAYETDPDECSCGSTSPLKNAQYIVPDGFMTDMTRASSEPIARLAVKQSRVSQHVLSEGKEVESTVIGSIRVRKYESAKFLFLNHGRSGEQFRLCLTCGTSVNAKILGQHKTPYGRTCTGLIHRCMIGHELVGEALAIEFEDLEGLTVPDDQAFYETLSYAIVEGISVALSIERKDLGVSVRRVARDGVQRREIVILDNVPGGAGYVAQMMRYDALEKSLRQAAKVASCGNCAEESTCYACLRSMENQALHDRMRRGPVMHFLQALCERLSGDKAVFGVDLDRWFGAPDVQEAFVATPTISDPTAHRILNLSQRSNVTLLLNGPLVPAISAWIDAWRPVWTDRVRVMTGTVEDAAAGVKQGNKWRVICGIAPLDFERGTVNKGRLLEGAPAAAFWRNVLDLTAPLRSGMAEPALHIPLAAGQRASEKELFDHLFEGVVERLTIEDPYLFSKKHEHRLAAWLELPKTRANVIIVTVPQDDPYARREQQAMFSRLKGSFGGKHDIKINYRNRREMHDRNVKIEGERNARVSLPKGLDFIGENGLVDKDTAVIIIGAVR